MKCSEILFLKIHGQLFLFSGFAKARKLKPSAVPSVQLPESSVPKRKFNKNQDIERYSRIQKRSNCVSVNPSPENLSTEVPNQEAEPNIASSLGSNVVSETLTSDSVDKMKVNLFRLARNAKVKVRGEYSNINSVLEAQNTVIENPIDIEMQVPVEVDTFLDTGNLKCTTGSQTSVDTSDKAIQVSNVPFIDALRTDEHLSTATGIESFQILTEIVKVAEKVASPALRDRKLTLREKIIMTYIKLKQNCSYAFLALLFNHIVTRAYCKTIFVETIQLLSAVLKVAIKWPTRDNISKNLPKCFSGFEDVAVVLDCTEIQIQNQSSLTNQLITYSTYKGHATWKIMTGVSPAGDITYLSPIYGGRVSDKAIFEQCNISNLLKPGDAIMVDKGFLIDKICDVNRWKLIRPPFLKDKKQLSKTDAELTSRIASARVHVERSNQRIKVFKVVGEKMSSCLLPIVEDIFTVICATVNLGAPILKADKFFS